MKPESQTKVLYKVAAALLGLLALTVGAALLPLGPFNTPVALAIAVVKATLVVLFFMEVRHSGQTTWIMAAASVVWLALLFAGTLADVLTRGPLIGPFP